MNDPYPAATLISPSGERVDVYCIAAFCRDNDLDDGNLNKVITGTRQHHKGWRNVYPPTSFVNKPQGLHKYLRTA